MSASIPQCRLQDYLEAMRGLEEQPAILNCLLAPFGLVWDEASPTSPLLVGWVLEDLVLENQEITTLIDPIDVALSCYALGDEGVEAFIDNAPILLPTPQDQLKIL